MEESVLTERAQAAGYAAPPAAALAAGGDKSRSDRLLSLVLASLDDDKAEDVIRIDLAGKSEMADWMVIASGRSSRQVSSISDNLAERLKAELGITPKMEGKETGDWVLIDGGDVIVHVFRPEVRDFYQLEKMWLSAEDQLRQPRQGAQG